MVTLTERAAQQVTSLMQENDLVDGFGLRVSISAGGCSGYSYVLDIEEQEDDDLIFKSLGVTILVDPKSHTLVDGLIVDYQTSMLGGNFKFDNPNAKKACGCGVSFQC